MMTALLVALCVVLLDGATVDLRRDGAWSLFPREPKNFSTDFGQRHPSVKSDASGIWNQKDNTQGYS